MAKRKAAAKPKGDPPVKPKGDSPAPGGKIRLDGEPDPDYAAWIRQEPS